MKGFWGWWQELMRRGNAHRTTASTHMNDTSSRSHAIFTVTFIQARLTSDTPLETRSKIHLVDLAGSERADATGATGQRLKEGAHINKSLVTLGSVISALAEQAARATAGKHVFIPYRDSVLTWLLKDSLGGNSKTIMIATISPADVNYGETLSTLRYANRAKNIINKPTINEDPNVKLIRELREEISSLKTLLMDSQVIGPEANSEAGSIMETLSQKQAKEKELTDQWTERWSETHNILQEQKTLGLRKAGQGVVLDSERPHLVLIDDNLLTTGVTLYHLNDGTTTIGSLLSQDIRLQGGEVLEEHCTIQLQEGVATLEANQGAQCWVNSQPVDRPTSLTQGCVVVLGGSHMFRYNDPQEAARLRKEGNKTHLNLSRLSFLSRSATDLLRSYDSLPGVEGELDRTGAEGSSVSRITKMTSLVEATNLCEISTQTSLHTHSQPSTPVSSHLDHASPSLRKSSLTLPLACEEEEGGGGEALQSVNSTPASDTFYTATSILSPDPRDLTSPLSPLPLDTNLHPHSGNVGNKDIVSSSDFQGAFHSSEPRIAVPVECAVSGSVGQGVVASSILPSAETQNGNICVMDTRSHCTTSGRDEPVSSPVSAFPTSPIPHPGDYVPLQGSPAVGDEATSTPIKTKEIQRGKKMVVGVRTKSEEGQHPSHAPDKCCVGAAVDNSASCNNNNMTGNANTEVNPVSEGEGGAVMEPPPGWLEGLHRGDTSALISPQTEVCRAAEVLMKLREKNKEADNSITEQIQELEALKDHYANLEDQLLEHYSAMKNRAAGAGGDQDLQVERPAHLPLDSTLMQEDRLALLIEREVQRRVLEEVVARENAALTARQPYTRTYRSMSASLDPTTLGLRVLTPSEMRPFTSLSAGCEAEEEGLARLYQSAASADDLLLTTAPLPSPMMDYDMSCGICICIPSYEMRGAGSSAHWEYEVKIAAGTDSWTVFRRYRRFRELHLFMCHKYGQPVEELYFPPRRLFGNFSERVVAERRGQLEVYLQQLIVLCSELEGSPLCGAPPSRASLALFSPFFQRGVFESSRHGTM